MTHQTPDVASSFGARWRLAGAKQHRHRPATGGVVDVDRQEAALAMVPVPERELLIAVDDIAGVIDIQRHRRRRSGIAGAVDIDHGGHQLRQFARGRRVLPAAHRGLARKPGTGARQLAQRQAEAGIVAKGVEIVGILVSASDREHPGAQDVGQRMDHPARVTRVGYASGKPTADAHRALSLCQ
jgi:hypothetical protein